MRGGISMIADIRRKDLILLAALAMLVFLLRWPSLEEALDNDTGAMSYHARLIYRGEPLYTTHHTGHHLPGTYYTYALAFFLFGDQSFATRQILVPWTILTVWAMYFLGVRLSGRRTGFLAGFFLALLTAHVSLKGFTAEPELFANLPVTLGILLAVWLGERSAVQRGIIPWMWVGVLGAWAVLYKIIFIAPFVTASIIVFGIFWQQRREAGALRTALLRLAAMFVGAVLLLVPVGLYFASEGALTSLLRVFPLGAWYVRTFTSNQIAGLNLPFLSLPIFILAVNNVVLLFFGLAGGLRMARNNWRLDRTFSPIGLGLAAWLVFSLLQVSLTGIGFIHYYLILVPVLALLAAWEMNELEVRFTQVSPALRRLLVWGAALAVLVNSAIVNRDVYVHYARYRIGLDSYQSFLTGRLGYGNVDMRMRSVASYIQSHSTPEDTIYAWSNDVQLYYLADRRCALEIIWPTYIAAGGPPERIFDLQPLYIVVTPEENLPRPEWLLEGIRSYYSLETIISGQEIYRRLSP
jgi:4-amino-4-deoxy-L-arabinose transferase-like glycosyltransferase